MYIEHVHVHKLFACLGTSLLLHICVQFTQPCAYISKLTYTYTKVSGTVGTTVFLPLGIDCWNPMTAPGKEQSKETRLGPRWPTRTICTKDDLPRYARRPENNTKHFGARPWKWRRKKVKSAVKRRDREKWALIHQDPVFALCLPATWRSWDYNRPFPIPYFVVFFFTTKGEPKKKKKNLLSRPSLHTE